MNRKKALSTTMLLLLALGVLSLSRFSLVSATPVSPYIMVKPEKTLNSAYTVGSNYTVSIYTDYNASLGNDAYFWQFSLTFNSSVLEGLQVSNGDLITTAKHTSARFQSGTFDNTVGTLSLTIAYFDHQTTKYTTTGPGTLANVTFRVIGYGVSNVHIGPDDSDFPPCLYGYNIAHNPRDYYIIDGIAEQEKMGDGFFSNKLIGDIDGDRDVDGVDFGIFAPSYGSLLGQPKYKQSCDLDLDGDVDGVDFGLFAPNYGRSI